MKDLQKSDKGDMKKISKFRYLMSKNGYQKDFFGTSFSYPIATWEHERLYR